MRVPLGRGLGRGLARTEAIDSHQRLFRESRRLPGRAHGGTPRRRPSCHRTPPSYPGADRPERHIRDMLGVVFSDHPDARRWTRHQAWKDSEFPLRRDFPAAGRPPAQTPADHQYSFLLAQGSGVYEIPVGPVHAGIIEPGHFRFQAVGETVLKLEERLGYTHKGIEKIAEGRDADGPGAAGRARLGRLHRRARLGGVHGDGEGGRPGGAAARPLAARPDVRARARRQSCRRHRRDAQRHRLRLRFLPVRAAARGVAAGLARGFRPPLHDGLHRPRRRGGGPGCSASSRQCATRPAPCANRSAG